ncbi:nucleotide-diphospho-sugar transferase [Phycomyces nitens]|nr:nucleotide-diphospho-sugar transferase [Phycomyces nitens]
MEAFVTLVATDSYCPGALVLAHRLRDLNTTRTIVCLVTPEVSQNACLELAKVCNVVHVNTLRSNDDANLRLLGRPELDITFTKLHVWRLTQYQKIVFLDADTLPLRNVDELFDWPAFSAAPDAGWPDCFNSGVFVAKPSEAVYSDLVQLASQRGSFDGGDQGLLNTYFSEWSTSPEHRLPFIYNTTPTAQYSYAPAHVQYRHSIAISHFIGQDKPWKWQMFADGKVFPRGNAWPGLCELVQCWWDTWKKHYGEVGKLYFEPPFETCCCIGNATTAVC